MTNLNHFVRNYGRLVSFVKPHSWRFGVILFSMFMNSLMSGLPVVSMIIPFVDTILAGKPIVVPHQDRLPVFMLDLIARINSLERWELLNLLIIVMIATSFLRALFEYLQTYFMNDVSHLVIRDLRNEVYKKIIHLPLSFFGKSQTGALVSRITYDTIIIRDAIAEGLTDFLFQPIQIIIYVTILIAVRYMFDVSWFLILIIFLILPFIVYPVIRVGQRLKKISRVSQDQVAGINSTLFESISGIRIVQGFGMEKYEIERFGEQNQSLYKTMMLSISRLIAVSPLTEFISFICLGIVLWLGSKEVIDKHLSPGAFVAFLIALFSLLRPFKRLSRVYGINQHAMAAAERLFETLDTPNTIHEKEKAKNLPSISKEIHFKELAFSYQPGQQVLKGIDFKVKVGEIVAIVGRSGAGKTSLMNLLPRFYDPDSGRILIDGTDIRDVTLKSLRDQIGLVTQETILFNDTVSANIAYGRSKTPLDQIEKAAKVANAHQFISKFPKRYQTYIGDRGMRLSGGEKQRVSIARAVLKNPPILILDEATSALDSESEILVQEAIHNLMKGRTVLVIAHRLSTIRDANRIVVIDDGRIVETGRHEELIEKSGVYKHLYDLQFKV